MALVDSLVVFVVGLLVGGLGIYVGARVLADAADYEHAVVTAALGALVWAVVGFLVGGVPLLGPLLTLLAYLFVVKRRYRTGWITAAGITIVAWVTVLVVFFVLARVGVTTFDAIGVPGV